MILKDIKKKENLKNLTKLNDIKHIIDNCSDASQGGSRLYYALVSNKTPVKKKDIIKIDKNKIEDTINLYKYVTNTLNYFKSEPPTSPIEDLIIEYYKQPHNLKYINFFLNFIYETVKKENALPFPNLSDISDIIIYYDSKHSYMYYIVIS